MFTLSFQINTADHSGSQWLTCFQETASEVLGISAEDLGQLRETDEQAYDDVFQKANFKEYVFRVRAKVDTFNVRDSMGHMYCSWCVFLNSVVKHFVAIMKTSLVCCM